MLRVRSTSSMDNGSWKLMIAKYIKIALIASCAIACASAQNFDSSGNATLKGDYFLREILMTGPGDGSVTTAGSVIGVATFDGNGNYTFKGQGATLAGGLNGAVSLTGKYAVAANGFLVIDSLAGNLAGITDSDYGGVSAVGPSAFVASATESSNVSSLIGIPAAPGATNGSMKGPYAAGSIDFPGASITSVRQATLTLNADGTGNLGTVAVSGVGANLGGTTLSQTIPGATYSLAGEGSGTINLGVASSSQLVSGVKTFYISADRNIVLGGSPSGYDMLVGIPAFTSGASNATASGIYFMGGLEEQIDTTQTPANAVDAFYGSTNATGSGISIFHNRIQSLAYPVYDYTFDSQYTVGPDGTIPFGDTPYEFTFGAGGRAFIGLGDAAATPALYSLTLGLATQTYSSGGVFLNPLGIVNSANFAPITNPIAPNEFITLVGSGMAGGNFPAQTLPLPTTLGNVKVLINGIAAPLDYVSATQIIALVPSSISPANGVFYATIQVVNNGAPSNQVTVYTNYTAPGVFAQPIAVGPAAAQHADYSLISSTSPANPGEVITLYGAGLGSVTPAIVPDGGAASSNPLSYTDEMVYVDFSLVNAPTIDFAGLTPTAAGLYQINVAIPSGTSNNVYVDVSTPEAVTSQATLSINTAAPSAVAKKSVSARTAGARRARSKAHSQKREGLKERDSTRATGAAR
jgi:uncharacterized protein (TIGR03437 family)